MWWEGRRPAGGIAGIHSPSPPVLVWREESYCQSASLFLYPDGISNEPFFYKDLGRISALNS